MWRNKMIKFTDILLGEEKWIQKAIEKPGALHKQLGVPADEKIPAAKLDAAAKKGGKLGKRARLAKTLKGLHKESMRLSEMYEIIGNRINTMKIETILGKLIPTLSEEDQRKITKNLCKLVEGAEKLNKEAFSIFTVKEYTLSAEEEVNAPINELLEHISGLIKNPSKDMCMESALAAVKVLDDLKITQ